MITVSLFETVVSPLAVVRIQVVYPVRKRNRLFCYVVKTQL
jgi:hypothetical protein